MWSPGSALSHQSDHAVLSTRSQRAVLGDQTFGDLPRGLVLAGVLGLLAAAAGHRVLRS